MHADALRPKSIRETLRCPSTDHCLQRALNDLFQAASKYLAQHWECVKASQWALCSIYQQLLVFTAAVTERVPVWHQSILLPTEHDANVGGVISGGVEVGVIACEKNREDSSEEGQAEMFRSIACALL